MALGHWQCLQPSGFYHNSVNILHEVGSGCLQSQRGRLLYVLFRHFTPLCLDHASLIHYVRLYYSHLINFVAHPKLHVYLGKALILTAIKPNMKGCPLEVRTPKFRPMQSVSSP